MESFKSQAHSVNQWNWAMNNIIPTYFHLWIKMAVHMTIECINWLVAFGVISLSAFFIFFNFVSVLNVSSSVVCRSWSHIAMADSFRSVFVYSSSTERHTKRKTIRLLHKFHRSIVAVAFCIVCCVFGMLSISPSFITHTHTIMNACIEDVLYSSVTARHINVPLMCVRMYASLYAALLLGVCLCVRNSFLRHYSSIQFEAELSDHKRSQHIL